VDADDVRFAYWRDTTRRPLVTLCRLVHHGMTAYGWAMCGPDDMACRGAGAELAHERALWALTKAGRPIDGMPSVRIWGRPIRRPEAIDVLLACEAQALFVLAQDHRFAPKFPPQMLPPTFFQEMHHAAD
jgi:hypothetical protein